MDNTGWVQKPINNFLGSRSLVRPSAIFASLEFCLLLLWQKAGVLVTSFAAHFIQLHLAPMPGRGHMRKLQNYSNWRERFTLPEFYVCVTPTAAVKFTPAGLCGYWVRRERRKENGELPLLFLSVSNPLSRSGQNQRASLWTLFVLPQCTLPGFGWSWV